MINLFNKKHLLTPMFAVFFAVNSPTKSAFCDVETTTSAPVAIEVVESNPPVEAILPSKAGSSSSFTEVDSSNRGPAAGVSLQTAKGEKLAVAMGHYARSRALLISALREFDKGYGLVDPSALVDAEGWRQGVTARAQELARVLDPQPRASRTGIRFDSSTAGTGDAGALKK